MTDTLSFKRSEFLCPCCGTEHMQQPFIDWLQLLSDDILACSGTRLPLIINSGYRCPKHSVAIGGYKDDAHVLGWAADLRCPSTAFRWLLISSAIKLGCKRIGIGASFVHLDLSPTHPQPHIWTYYH